MDIIIDIEQNINLLYNQFVFYINDRINQNMICWFNYDFVWCLYLL